MLQARQNEGAVDYSFDSFIQDASCMSKSAADSDNTG